MTTAILKWVGIMILNLLGLLTSIVVFPLAYILRDVKIVRNKILWIYYDDEDEFGWDVHWWMVGKKKGFISAYRWCVLRNPAWNLQGLFIFKEKPSQTNSKILNSKGTLTKGGKKVDDFGVAVLKYVDKDGNYMDNMGEFLSLKYSIIGSKSLVFNYTNKETGKISKYFRYSFANHIINSFWVELQIGFTTRPTFRMKLKNITKSIDF